jgi:hypothetical protein
MSPSMFGHFQIFYHHTYRITIALDMLNDTIVYFTFYDNRGPEGDKTRLSMLPENHSSNLIQIRS